MAPETTVVTTNEDPQEDGSVLAEAAVLSATMAGASLAKADAATDDAAAANAKADAAQATSTAALGMAATSVDEQRAREIAREEYDLSRSAEATAIAEPVVEVVEVEDLPEQVLPKSVRKANGEAANDDGKKGSWAQRHGLVS
jgi:hypothetical protein